jgi:hypothetical protein
MLQHSALTFSGGRTRNYVVAAWERIWIGHRCIGIEQCKKWFLD